MKFIKAQIQIAIISLIFATTVFAEFQPFTIKDIRIEGLRQISAGTVFNYLPAKAGDTVDSQKVKNIIHDLFKTRFFKDIQVEREGSVLVIIVTERPGIASIKFTGNKEIKGEQLTKALQQIGFAEGQVFDRSILEKVELELQRQYFSRGKYGVKIKTTVTPLTRNRVGITIDVKEGAVAKIGGINIVGNHAFKEKTLLRTLELKKSNKLSFLTHKNQYSRQKLAADLETIRSYYLDRGYVNFTINSTQVSITPDKTRVFIVVNITEGDQYQIGKVKLAGKFVFPPEDLFKILIVAPGDVFSRKAVSESTTNITDLLGDEGYAFANVNAMPEIDEEKKIVTLTFFIDPGKRAYVRRVNISGNTKTRDEVVRREIRQQEGGWISTELIHRSKERIQRLGYFKDVNVETVPVPGTTDQVDVNFGVEEHPSGSLSAGIGYSQSQGFIFNTSIAQQNFLGSGKYVNVGFNNSYVNTIYSFGYTNPYFTEDGISRGFNAYYRKTNPLFGNIASYTSKNYGADLTFTIPINELDNINLGAGYQNADISLTDTSPIQYEQFVQSEGNSFDIYSVNFGWAHDGRDSAIFPTRGGYQNVFGKVAVPIGSLHFYEFGYKQSWYQPLSRTKPISLMLRADIAYGGVYGGTHIYPFFENFYAGGINSVRGFRPNTLGPKTSDGLALGGNFQLIGNAEVFFPVPFLNENKLGKSLRMSAFVDTGNVYAQGQTVSLSTLRYSAGISAMWLSPFGTLRFSLAKALRTQPGDFPQVFQFSMGTQF
ncbi:outer membrane protein assembly factor BamA [Candidatus Nitrosacidococcus sp. I8]|uniref:outer membrane protein assembly factor BamA n=1 Tax=Candidatus Nitrosacidococcus sp. I8 TaxID=2942908 RepID=UPI00222631EE|nr:outer membrane protein assembly factor BamA [Candidatus Nitrosacidococcus sp. I8]CAH9017468.1 Outer membrane protein assembly factor BamA [Candidatus Nitrosacidococcus sp. I8]